MSSSPVISPGVQIRGIAEHFSDTCPAHQNMPYSLGRGWILWAFPEKVLSQLPVHSVCILACPLCKPFNSFLHALSHQFWHLSCLQTEPLLLPGSCDTLYFSSECAPFCWVLVKMVSYVYKKSTRKPIYSSPSIFMPWPPGQTPSNSNPVCTLLFLLVEAG